MSESHIDLLSKSAQCSKECEPMRPRRGILDITIREQKKIYFLARKNRRNKGYRPAQKQRFRTRNHFKTIRKTFLEDEPQYSLDNFLEDMEIEHIM